MKNLVQILILILFPFVGETQNLITNPSFEDIDSCYGDASPIGFDVFQWTGCVGWSCPTFGSSDLWCENPVYGIATPPFIPGIGYQIPHSGENHSGLIPFERVDQNYREYIQNQLSEPLVANQYYQFSLYVSATEDSINYSSCLQAYFSVNPVSSTSYYVLPLIPQWKNYSQNFIRDTVGWQFISGIFKAAGGEQFVTIGCFDDSANVVMLNKDPNTTSDLYYFIDDVSLIKAPIEISFPNIFTPNNDGVNDLFEPIITGLSDYKVYVYNRWGNKMYELTSTASFWDGKGADDGVYFYILESNQLNIKEQGFFQLIR